jgi:hypothetical protein
MIYLNAEIRKEYEPQGITHVKRLISRQTGQEVKYVINIVANCSRRPSALGEFVDR